MISKDFTSLSSRENIIIKGARVHNLKNIDVAIPRNKFVVITGVSGSGKSSLAFDTLYAEGQRRYVESLSAYARQFLGKLDKPEVDYIKGISPAIAIEQKVNTRNPRSTVGTSTEIHDYLKLLFARIGKTFSPVSGGQVKRQTVDDVIKFIQALEEETKFYIFSPIKIKKGRLIEEQLSILQQQGFSRVKYLNEIKKIEELIEILSKENQVAKKVKGKKKKAEDGSLSLKLLIDRVEVKHHEEENQSRIADSLQTAFYEGEGELELGPVNGDAIKKEISSKTEVSAEGNLKPLKFEFPVSFCNRFELDGIKFEEPTVHFFSFNNPVGACKTCEGFGSIIGIDEDLVVPNKTLSVFEEAIVCWKGEKMREWKEKLILNNHKFGFPIHKPFFELSEEQKRLLWTGNKFFGGLNDFFKFLERESYKIQYRVMLSRYKGKTVCYDCRGSRLRKDANYVKVAGKSITEIGMMQVKDSLNYFETLPSHLSEYEIEISKRLLKEIINRLRFLNNVGLGYLTLNRVSSTLSGGESQRINLATSLGSSLVGSMYILDEPSIGLHSRDTQKLIQVLESLKKLGNTVIVVEHDEEIMRKADYIIDLGPEAGTLGGELVFEGRGEEWKMENGTEQTRSHTLNYLNGKEKIETPTQRRKWKNYIEIAGITEHNLTNVSAKFPLEILTVVTGVSGSGKSTLVKKALYSSLKKMINHKSSYGNFGVYTEKNILFTGGQFGFQAGNFEKLNGDIHLISGVEFVDQNPIGKSSRSNPVTYLKAYDEIRNLFAEQKLSKMRGYRPSHFSFNVEGGRCEACQGEGVITVEMQFMADVYLPCEECKGKRFKDEVLEVEYLGKNISDILRMTVDDAITFFTQKEENGPNINLTLYNENPAAAGHWSKKEEIIAGKLKTLQEVGLGYVQLGQSSSTLSGGEAQRIKLASFLNPPGVREENGPLNSFIRKEKGGIFFIFDEPTTGLHFHDIKKLLKAFNALIEQGHTILIIEHNPEVIKSADWVIDMGPEGGDEGGKIIFEGTPEGLAECENSYTGKFLRGKLLV